MSLLCFEDDSTRSELCIYAVMIWYIYNFIFVYIKYEFGIDQSIRLSVDFGEDVVCTDLGCQYVACKRSLAKYFVVHKPFDFICVFDYLSPPKTKRMNMRNQLLKASAWIVVLLFSVSGVMAQKADRIVGLYSLVSDVTKEASKVKIYKAGQKYEAQIVWLAHPNDESGKPKLDRKNPDEKLRSRTIIGTVIMKGIAYDSEEDCWDGGKIYDPATGKTYKVTCRFENDKTLVVRGYIGIPTLGRSLKWTKVE